eukprot:scaffold45458_cov168-Amphora_coffeaeformis.AAC.1
MKHASFAVLLWTLLLVASSYAWRPTFPLSTRRLRRRAASSRREFKFDVTDDNDESLASILTSRIATTNHHNINNNNNVLPTQDGDSKKSSGSSNNNNMLPMPLSRRQEEIWNMMIDESSRLASADLEQQPQEPHKFRIIRPKESLPV